MRSRTSWRIVGFVCFRFSTPGRIISPAAAFCMAVGCVVLMTAGGDSALVLLGFGSFVTRSGPPLASFSGTCDHRSWAFCRLDELFLLDVLARK